MRLLLAFFALLAPTLAIAECDWSDEFPIPNEKKLSFRECVSERKIRIGQTELQANIDFQIVHANYPEGNSIWSVHSPDGETAVVYIENSSFQRNAWVIDTVTRGILLSIDHSEGRHFAVQFDDNDRFRVIHAGMGYRTDYLYERDAGAWTSTGRVDKGGVHPDCNVSAGSRVSFSDPEANDQLSITIYGEPCYEAILVVSIVSDTDDDLYRYEARFKPHTAVHWEDASLNEYAERLADRFADPESFGLTSDLPQWLPEADYYEANYQIIQTSKKDYEELRRKGWITYTHSIHYEGWRVVAFDPINRRSVIVSEGTL